MDPVKFPESNALLKCQEEVGGEPCGDLPVYTDGKVCVSLWKLTVWDRIRAILYGNLWLFVWTGRTQPPVGLIMDKTIFIEEKKPWYSLKERRMNDEEDKQK